MEAPLNIQKTHSSPEKLHNFPLHKTDSKTLVIRPLLGMYGLRKYNSEDKGQNTTQKVAEVQQTVIIPRQSSFLSSSNYRGLTFITDEESITKFNIAWKKRFRSLNATLKPKAVVSDLQGLIDEYFREIIHASCIPTSSVFKKNHAILKGFTHLDKAFLSAVKIEVRKASRQLELYCLTEGGRTLEVEGLYQKFQALAGCQSFADFKKILLALSSENTFNYRVLAKYFHMRGSRLIENLDGSYHQFQKTVESVVEELKELRSQARKLTSRGSQTEQEYDVKMLDQITHDEVMICLGVENISFLPIKVNDVYVQEIENSYLLGLIHLFNSNGLDPHPTLESSKREKEVFKNKYPTRSELLLKLSSNVSWRPIEKKIRVKKKSLFLEPFETRCQNGIECDVIIKSERSYTVTQLKKYETKTDRGQVGGFTMEWRVSYHEKKGFKSKLRLKDWGINDKAPLGDKWLFLANLVTDLKTPRKTS